MAPCAGGRRAPGAGGGAAAALLLCTAAPGVRGGREVRRSEAVFGMGCYFSARKVFQGLPGVLEVDMGYMGGAMADPTQEKLRRAKEKARKGVREVVRVVYDTRRIPYRKLLDAFFHGHDARQGNGQGSDIGEQFLSAIFVTSSQKKYADEQVRKESSHGEVATKVFDAEGVKFYKAVKRASKDGEAPQPPRYHCKGGLGTPRGGAPAAAPAAPPRSRGGGSGGDKKAALASKKAQLLPPGLRPRRGRAESGSATSDDEEKPKKKRRPLARRMPYGWDAEVKRTRNYLRTVKREHSAKEKMEWDAWREAHSTLNFTSPEVRVLDLRPVAFGAKRMRESGAEWQVSTKGSVAMAVAGQVLEGKRRIVLKRVLPGTAADRAGLGDLVDYAVKAANGAKVGGSQDVLERAFKTAPFLHLHFCQKGESGSGCV